MGDHLGSTELTLDSAGNRLAANTELRYHLVGRFPTPGFTDFVWGGLIF